MTSPPVTSPLLRSVPNVLSGLRLGLAVALPLSEPRWWLAIVLVAGVSDWLDGFLARRYELASWSGGLLDSTADKAFCVTALVTLTAHGSIAPWQIPLILMRDFAVAGGVLVSALRRDGDAFRHMSSRIFGKLTTVALFTFLGALLLWPTATAVHRALFLVTTGFSFSAAADYVATRYRGVVARVERPAAGSEVE